MSADRMTCMTCGKTKAYPDGYPNRMFAECWQCAWNAHVRADHPKVVKNVRREVRKRARRLVEADLRRAAVGNEVALLWPPNGTPTAVAEATDETTEGRG